jgi:hypothetical protein
MNLDHASIGRDPPEEVNAIIEVPIGGEPIEYEMDKRAGSLVVDRFLYTCAILGTTASSRIPSPKTAIPATSWLSIPGRSSRVPPSPCGQSACLRDG